MDMIRMCGSFCVNLVYVPSQIAPNINGRITGIAAMQNFASSLLVVAQKAFSAFNVETPRIDYVVTLLSGAHEVLIVPQSVTTLADTVRQAEKLSNLKKLRLQTVCKLAYLATALLSQSVRLLEFIDSHGGHTLATLIEYDHQNLGGLVTRVGSSCVFNKLGIATLEGFKTKMAILSSLLVIVHALVSYKNTAPVSYAKKKKQDPTGLDHVQTNFYKRRKFDAQPIFKTLIAANEFCKIGSICYFGKTNWQVACFNVISSLIEVSKESYRAYHVGSKAATSETLPTLDFAYRKYLPKLPFA